MNIQTIIEGVEKEFEEKDFWRKLDLEVDSEVGIDYEDRKWQYKNIDTAIKSFLSQSLRQAIETVVSEVVETIEGMRALPTKESIFNRKNAGGSHVDTWNDCISDILTAITAQEAKIKELK